VKYNLSKGSHSVYSFHYLLIFAVKYRRKIINEIISRSLKKISESHKIIISIFWSKRYWSHTYIIIHQTNISTAEICFNTQLSLIKNIEETISTTQEKVMWEIVLVEFLLYCNYGSSHTRNYQKICGKSKEISEIHPHLRSLHSHAVRNFFRHS